MSKDENMWDEKYIRYDYSRLDTEKKRSMNINI